MSTDHCLAGLKSIRKIRGVSVAKLASTIGLKPTSYSRFERGERRAYLDHARTIAHHLGVHIDDLVHPLTEDDAALLCDKRDKEAILAGTFNRALWRPGEPDWEPPAPLPSPPLQTAPAPPPPALPPASSGAAVPETLEGWDIEQ